MKKYLPNILLVLVVLATAVFTGMYILDYGMGKFLTTTGMVFLIFGILFFIFFLSIDPGYGWIQSMNFTKNYIMLFVAMGVCVVGVVLLVVGGHAEDLRERTVAQENRCQDLRAGHVTEVMKNDWYSLRDFQTKGSVRAYLLRKKNDRAGYKVVTTLGHGKEVSGDGRIRISSPFISWPMTTRVEETTCPGVFEETVELRYQGNPEATRQVYFDVQVTLSGLPAAETGLSAKDTTVSFHLADNPADLEDIRLPAGQYAGVTKK